MKNIKGTLKFSIISLIVAVLGSILHNIASALWGEGSVLSVIFFFLSIIAIFVLIIGVLALLILTILNIKKKK